MSACPRCGTNVEDFLSVDAGMRLALQAADYHESVPDSCCANCYSELSSVTTKGAQLRAEKSARSQNLRILWKNRLRVLKQARQRIQSKQYSEAAILYEKYLRICEIVNEKESGELFPELFQGPNRRKEITAVTSVYWDLVKIYDTGSRQDERMQRSADKMALFLPLAKSQKDFEKKIRSFGRGARNPQIVKSILKKANIKSSGCFVATAVYGDANCWQVNQLRNFRDTTLTRSRAGRKFIDFYYSYGPIAADWVSTRPRTKSVCRRVLDLVSRVLSKEA